MTDIEGDTQLYGPVRFGVPLSDPDTTPSDTRVSGEDVMGLLTEAHATIDDLEGRLALAINAARMASAREHEATVKKQHMARTLVQARIEAAALREELRRLRAVIAIETLVQARIEAAALREELRHLRDVIANERGARIYTSGRNGRGGGVRT